MVRRLTVSSHHCDSGILESDGDALLCVEDGMKRLDIKPSRRASIPDLKINLGQLK